MKNEIIARQVSKILTTPGAVPTVPASNDHTDGTWLSTDIYQGEFCLNTADNIIYTRIGSVIYPIYTGWNKVTLGFAAWQPNPAAFGLINAIPVPAGYQLDRVILKHTIAFGGGSSSNATVQIWDSSGTVTLDNSLLNVFAAPTNINGIISPAKVTGSTYTLTDISAGSTWQALLTITGDVIDNITQGSIDIYYRLDKVPIV